MGLNPLDVIGSAADFAKNIVDRIWPKKMDEAEKAAAVAEIEKLIQAREETLTNASRDIIVAELNQGDLFTKRLRPSIGYTGLFVIVFNYVLIPFINRVMEWIFITRQIEGSLALYALKPVELPEAFWVAWGGVCAVYSIGRTMEKGGANGRLVGWMTGNGKK